MQLAGQTQIRLVIWAQIGASGIVAAVLLLFGTHQAWSGLIGGLIAASANALAAVKVFTRYRAQDPGKVLGRLFGAELSKLLYTAALFAVAFVSVKPLSAGALLGTYLFIQAMVPLIVLFFYDRLKTRY